MKLSQIILEGPLEYDPDFNREVDKIQDQGGKYLGSGDYGSVYLLKGKAVKVTTDSIELEQFFLEGFVARRGPLPVHL